MTRIPAQSSLLCGPNSACYVATKNEVIVAILERCRGDMLQELNTAKRWFDEARAQLIERHLLPELEGQLRSAKQALID